MKLIKAVSISAISILLSVTTLFAQQFHVEKSAEFDEPNALGTSWNKVLQLKNGTTFLFHSDDGRHGKSLDVTVFDKNRKVVATKSITSDLWMASDADKRWVYEINGEPVVFLYFGDGEFSLRRIRLSATDGSLVDDVEVAHPDGSNRTIACYKGIDVAKDPASDCYAVISHSPINGHVSQSISVVHFDGTHKKIGDATFNSQGTGCKDIMYNSALVDGNKSVYLVICGYDNGLKLNQVEHIISGKCKVVIAKLNAGEKVVKSKTMNVNVDFAEVTSQMLFNRSTNQIQLRTMSLSHSKDGFLHETTTKYYLSLITYFDPETLGLVNIKPLFGEKVTSYGQAHINKDYSYTGTPKNMVINRDNTTAILMEERPGGYLGAIGVSQLSDTGAELTGYAIKKAQAVKELFSSFDYVSTPHGNYVITNDLPGNFEKDEDESKHKKVSVASLTNTIGYKLNGDHIDKFMLFGEPDGNSSTFCYINGGDYNEASNVFATVIVERDGRSKQARMAWVTFD